jgi:UDP-glucuronate 4-epimerase
MANEGTARVYWHDHGISSVALRPYTVYGVGRDQGVTSEPTVAMAAAARGEDAHISFGGTMQLQWASDVARQFLDAALVPGGDADDGTSGARPSAQAADRGAFVYDLGGPLVTIEEVARIIERVRPDVRVTVGDSRLPFPKGFDDGALRSAAPRVYETPLEEGVRRTIERFEALAAA